jgi:hypothetical protein
VGTQGRIALALLCLVAAAGCSLEKGRKGDTCTRSAQCAAGLVCIGINAGSTDKPKDGKCSSDLSSLNDPSQIPMLMPGMPAADAGLDAAATGDDAGVGQ